MYKVSANDKVIITNVQDINGEVVLSNPGYPNSFRSQQDLRWIVTARSDMFIGLTFTDLSLYGEKVRRILIKLLQKKIKE
jgi:hypothetical protein